MNVLLVVVGVFVGVLVVLVVVGGRRRAEGAGPHGIRLHPEGSWCRLSSLAGGQPHDVSRR